jgi:ribosomal protein S18 acetylase RimI-like enzyme
MVKLAALWFLHILQGMKIYRVVARKLIGKRVCYQVADFDDASDLDGLYGYDKFSKMENQVETFAEQIKVLQSCGYILIARLGHQLAAATILRWFPDGNAFYPDWWLFGMLVRPRYQAAGIGEGLVHMAVEKIAVEGGNRVNLLVFEHNKVAINLYRKLGFFPASIHGLEEDLMEEAKRGEHRRIIMSKYL